jgi:hypothetical protein
VNVPAAVGVPVIAPVVESRVRPLGSAPVATEKVNGAVPPVTIIAGLVKATPTSPELTEEQASEGPAITVYGHELVTVLPLLSVTVIEKLPASVGVPLITPVE